MTVTAKSGEENGGAGGSGVYGNDGKLSNSKLGGAGNPGAEGGNDGTGGLIIIYASQFENKGIITSQGSDAVGGASGGGSVNVFYNELIEEGNIDVKGGNSTSGGNGGDGCITFQDINSKTPVAMPNTTIYVDSNNGNDENGNGSVEQPYATLDKIADSGIIENGYSYKIILKDGTYNLTTKMFELNCDDEINIIGNKEKTRLIVNGIYSNSSGGNPNYVLNFYRLIWDGNNYMNNNIINPITDINFYAVAFTNIATDGWTSYFCPMNNSNITLNNCTLEKKVTAMLRTTNGSIKLTNCYGGFTSGYSTSDTQWNYETNRILESYTLGDNYSITEDETLWKDVGTGTDPDGSQANLGVYGGKYSWEFDIK